MGLSLCMSTCRVLHHIVTMTIGHIITIIILGHISIIILGHIVTTMILYIIVAFDTTVAFVIPLVVLLT
jgi:hypothetical protein